MISGAASMPSPLTSQTTANSAPDTWSRKSLSAARSPDSRIAENAGTKAMANEPSAKIRRR